MPEPADPSPSHATAGDVTIVLLLPDAVRGAEDAVLKTLNGAERPIRVLLCLADDHQGNDFVAALEAIRVETQILLGPKVAEPAAKTIPLRAPPDMVDKDLKEFALALSDVVLMVAPSASDSEAMKLFKETVKDLEKLMAAPGAAMAYPDALGSATHNLDPNTRHWRSWGRWFFGRTEQGLIEIFAFNWFGYKKGGIRRSTNRLIECCWSWRPKQYFAPDHWPKLAPDRTADDQLLPIVTRFEALDRSATYGSYIHRDLTWFTHLAAAFAVLAAVWGHLDKEAEWWGIAELVALVSVVVLVGVARVRNLQERWTACRLGAEQLRIARMSFPLLVLPPAFATEDKAPESRGHDEDVRYRFEALTEVKRIVREHGLPPRPDLTKAAKWVKFIVDDQIIYHQRNHQKLECAEGRLLVLTQFIFILGIAAVIAHLCTHNDWLLLGTAAAPAFAAALHGIGTRLGIVHRAALSKEMETQLEKIRTSLAKVIEELPTLSNFDAWKKVRHLTSEAAKAMGSENTSWHGLVRRYRDVLP